MTARRHLPSQSAPDLQPRETPAASGEYRFVAPHRRRRSADNIQAVRPEEARPQAKRQPAPTSKVGLCAERAAPAVSGTPRRYAIMEIQAVESPMSGRMLDDSLDFDFDIDADGALELDRHPAVHHARKDVARTPSQSFEAQRPPQAGMPGRSSTNPAAARPSSTKMAAVRPSSSSAMSAVRPSSASAMAAVDTHAALMAFAGFGEPPQGMFSAPAYALRVMRRRRKLVKDLEHARNGRTRDVGVYEAALRTADADAVRTGWIVLASLSALSLLFVVAVARLVMGLVGPGR